MANPSQLDVYLNGIPDETTKRVLKAAFYTVLKSNLRFGNATAPASVNMAGLYISGVTPSVANREFSVPHKLGSAPYLLTQVLPLDQVGASMVRLTVSRVADANNVYLKSPDTGQTVFLYVEG